MTAGTVFVVAALSLFLWNRHEDQKAEQAADAIMLPLAKTIDEAAEEVIPDPYSEEMTVITIDGYDYIGYLSVPRFELYLPVMAEWDYDRLKIAPCRYTGSVKTNDLVIAAHNYSRHFGPIRELEPGDEVSFTDADGVVTHYTVETVEVLEPTAVEDMTAGDYDLTLFTCTYGGKSRMTVRCVREQE